MRKTKRNELGIILCLSCLLGSTILHAQNNTHGAYVGDKDKLHVYLLIGQSNMAGRAPFTEKESAPIDQCYLLNNEDKWEPARNPLNRHSTIRKRLGMQKMNPGYSFSKSMLEKDKGISIGLVVNAKGGTKIEQWQKGGHFYREALRRIVEAQKTGILKGVLWHQGESNSKTPDTYLEKLKQLISDLRKDLEEPNLPFVAGQVFYHPQKKPNTRLINQQIAKLPDAMAFTGCAASKGLTTLDNTHFNLKGMKLLGQRYAEEIFEIQKQMKAEEKNSPDKK